ncbi:MAG: diguanylate cyclase, partial [Nitratireductor sp.]
DEVIKEFSARIKKNIRNIDLACRYGGEEFAIIMPDTSQELAGIVAERIRANIEKHPFIAANGSKQLPITVSIGVSCVSADDGYAEKILKRADVAL